MVSEPSVNEIIVHGIVVGAFQENCWVIGNRRTGEAICVDPGDQPDEILAMAKDMGVSIRYIANSHAHIDHVLGVRGVIEATGAKFLLHASDLELLRNTASSARRWTGTEIANPPDPDGFLADGDEIDIDGLKARVIHTWTRRRSATSASGTHISEWSYRVGAKPRSTRQASPEASAPGAAVSTAAFRFASPWTRATS